MGVQSPRAPHALGTGPAPGCREGGAAGRPGPSPCRPPSRPSARPRPSARLPSSPPGPERPPLPPLSFLLLSHSCSSPNQFPEASEGRWRLQPKPHSFVHSLVHSIIHSLLPRVGPAAAAAAGAVWLEGSGPLWGLAERTLPSGPGTARRRSHTWPENTRAPNTPRHRKVTVRASSTVGGISLEPRGPGGSGTDRPVRPLSLGVQTEVPPTGPGPRTPAGHVATPGARG